MEKDEKDPLPVRLKYYTTLTLGLVACLSCFVFMFMVPFFLEPSISTLLANFDPEPVVCKTVYMENLVGLKNCSWSSCKKGCTVDQIYCDRVYVDYMLKKYSEFDGTEYEDEEDVWAIRGVPVFVNIKACGYPPRVNCSVFTDSFGSIGTIFPCYYSRADPSLVITDYSWAEAVQSLVMALIIPNLLTGISLGVLSYWWYPGCQKRRCQYQLPPDQEAASIHQGENEDEEEDDDDMEADADDEDVDKRESKIDYTKDNENQKTDLDTPVKITLQ